MKEYTLAVIIPCWNCEFFIGKMLDGLLNQTLYDWKAFLVDDGSTDGTAAVVKEYSKKDARINYALRNRGPKGAQVCRNIGFELSEGAKYVVFFDADDLVAPYCFEQRTKFMDIHQDLDFGVFMAKSFMENPEEIDGSLLFGFRYNDGVDDMQRLLRRTHPFVVWDNIYRRESLIRSGLVWDEKILSLQDSDFNSQALIKGMKYDYDDNCRIDYFYRTWHSSDCTSRRIYTDAHKKSHVYLFDKIYNSLSKCQAEKYLNEIDDYLLFFINKYRDDRSFLSGFLQLNWVRCRPWFCLRIRIYSVLLRHNRNGKKWLFPTLSSFRKEYDLQYRAFQRDLLNKAIIRAST